MLFPDETIARVHHHSHGIPRLINTVCENALIGAFARQLKAVPPDIIEEVANDFRLDVTPAPRSQPIADIDDNGDLWQAVKTMLQFHSQRQAIQSREAESLLATVPGASQHEPIV